MSNALKNKAFQTKMGAVPPEVPTVPTEKTLDLHHTLIREEYAEVTEAVELLRATEDGDAQTAALAHLMHECADLLFVTYGMMVACGVDADEVYGEISRANMHKASGPRRADGKVLKPDDFVPADVLTIIRGQMGSGGDGETGRLEGR